jgi:hypothetical protein
MRRRAIARATVRFRPLGVKRAHQDFLAPNPIEHEPARVAPLEPPRHPVPFREVPDNLHHREALARAVSTSRPYVYPAATPYDEYTFPPHQRTRLRNGADGLIRSEQVVDSLAFKTEWLRRRLAAAPRDLVLLEVVGDAMAPTLGDTDLILVDLSQPRFRQDGVYVLRRDGDLEVKRLQRGPAGSLIIKSDNSAYESTVVTRDRVGIIGRVIWAAGWI